MSQKKKSAWNIEQLSKHCHRVNFSGVRAGWEQWVLLMSDEHWDNSHCDRALLKRHHDEAVERNAPIFKFGDLFCAMQGKWDRRADQDQLRPEHRGNNYLDLLKRTAAEWYQPYRENIALITPGNHEASICDRHQTDLTECLTHDLGVMRGSYWGYVRFAFDCGKVLSRDLHYHHGYGGGGEVTRGLIDNSRTRGQYLADIYVSGHVHRRNMDENIITECAGNGSIIKRRQVFLRSSTYKDEQGGWHAMQGRSSRPLGGWWLRFVYRRGSEHTIDFDVTAAT